MLFSFVTKKMYIYRRKVLPTMNNSALKIQEVHFPHRLYTHTIYHNDILCSNHSPEFVLALHLLSEETLERIHQ